MLLLLFVRCIHLENLSSNELYESEKEESKKLGSESSSAVMFGTGLVGLLHCVVFTLGVTIYADESYDGDGGSLAVP